MKRLILTLSLLLSLIIVNAQKTGTDIDKENGDSLMNLAKTQYESGNITDALENARLGVEMIKESMGTDSKEHLSATTQYAFYLIVLGQFDQAFPLLTENLEKQRTLLGERHPDFAKTLSFIGAIYRFRGDYNKALELCTRALELRRELLGEDNDDFIWSLDDVAGINSDLGNFEEAFRIGKITLEKVKKRYGVNSQKFADYLSNYAVYARRAGNYKEAIDACKECLAIYENISLSDNNFYIITLSNLAHYYSLFGDYDKSLQTAWKAEEKLKKTLGENHKHYISLLNQIATIYYYKGNYPEAVRIGEIVIERQKALLGATHPDYLSVLSNLCSYYSDLGNYSRAIELALEVLETRKIVLGEMHPHYLTSLNNIATFHIKVGNYQQGEAYLAEAEKLAQSIYPGNHPDMANLLCNIGMAYVMAGNYEKGDRYLRRSLRMYRQLYGESNPKILEVYNNLRSLYVEMGNYTEAIRLGEKVVEMRREIVGEESPLLALSLNYLSNSYFAVENFDKAFALNQEALNILSHTLGEEHPDYIAVLLTTASFCSHLGLNDQAIEIGETVADWYARNIGKKTDAYATTLNNLAEANYKAGNMEKAIALARETAEIYRTTRGEAHPSYTLSLINLCRYHYTLSEPVKILPIAREVSNNIAREIASNFSFLTLKERNAYWNMKKPWLKKLLPLFARAYPHHEFSGMAYDAALLSKGILLNSEIEFSRMIAGTDSEDLLKRYNKIKDLRLQLAKLYEKPVADRYCDTDSLERRVNAMERRLLRESAEYGDFTANLSVKWQDVKKALGKNDLAIEFMALPVTKDSIVYMANVLSPEFDTPQLVELFAERDIATLTRNDIYRTPVLSKMLWGKLAPYTTGAQNIYFSPDGKLHTIAIEYLSDYESDTQLSNRFNLCRLSSTRELALNHSPIPATQAIVYGGIQYDPNEETPQTESRKYGVGYLPQTKVEAESVSTIMNAGAISTTLLSGTEASEESFKSQSYKINGILHLATHGFYWEEEEAELQALINQNLTFLANGKGDERSEEECALARTGLFMAGANYVLAGHEVPEGCDDGILTAKEIADMDLRGLNLVVLSACQTGQGDIDGDGVFGLQRGFKKAGAGSILMSLWDVDDLATRILMTSFYENLLSGLNKRQALVKAQHSVKNYCYEDENGSHDFSNPDYWAAFIILDALD